MFLVVTLTGCPGLCPRTPTPPPDLLRTRLPTPVPVPPPSVPDVADIVVSFPGAAETRPLLLYSGSRDGSCRHFEPFVGQPNVLLTGVAYDPGCPAEIYVFARGSSAFGLVVDPLKPGSDLWLKDALASKTLSVPLAPPVQLPLHLWLVADAADVTEATDLRDRLLNKAYPIMDALGTGVTLDTITSVLASTAIKYDCDDFAAIISKSATYDVNRLNVYLVKYYLESNWTPAYNCIDVLHPEIIFISWGYANQQDPTLAHEIGHSLGLTHPLSLWGHTIGVAPFKNGNFMWNGADITDVSIGQLYAMTFSRDSWLNSDKSAFRRPDSRLCQDSWSAGSCPALDAFVAGGWPPP